MKILIAKDDEILMSALKVKFTKVGAEITACTDGDSAVAALSTEDFDGVVLDILMPGKNGFEVMMAMKNTRNKATPTFVITNLGREDDQDKAMELGASRFYVKSRVSIKDVVSEITDAIQA